MYLFQAEREVELLPRYDYECSKGHITERTYCVKDKPRTVQCSQCRAKARAIISNITISGSGLGVRGSPSGAYWPSKGIAQERVIKNLGHNPIVVGSKAEYRKLLEKTNSREVG